MSVRYVHQVEYRCDSCLVRVVGTDADLPPDWTEEEIPNGVRHYCPECSEPPKEPA